MNAPVQAVTRYEVEIVAKVEATVKGRLSFTDADVREWAELEGADGVDPELIEEYANELIGEEGDLEVVDVDYWKRTDVTVLGSSREMQVPPEFVPLPGMGGDL
ncbi:hypothetical protein ACTJI8_12955 [Microbacterium sp. 22303]|uniref:hypothetical protein n=1 Tax=Microbacterium sp. 22303 TaxID=3453905 RepID=UPI003F85A114